MFPCFDRAVVDSQTHGADLMAFLFFNSSKTNLLAAYPGSTKLKLKQSNKLLCYIRISHLPRPYFCARTTLQYADNRRPGYTIIR